VDGYVKRMGVVRNSYILAGELEEKTARRPRRGCDGNI
jgi:hypothetical protein